MPGEPRPSGLHGAPLARWMWPFVVVALAAQLSAAGIADLHSGSEYAASCIVLGARVIVVALLFQLGLGRAARLVAPLGYLASLLLLFASQAGAGGGLRSLVLLPIVWGALYHRTWEAVVIAVGAVAVLGGAAALAGEAAAVTARLVLLWGSMGALVVISVQSLRRWLGAALAEREYALRRAETLGAITEALNSTLDPQTVVGTALRKVCDLTGVQDRRVRYLQEREGDLVALEAPEDGLTPRTVASSGHERERFAEARRTRSAARGRLPEAEGGRPPARAPDPVGPVNGRPATRPDERRSRPGGGFGTWIPVIAEDSVHGVLAIESTAGQMAPGELSLLGTIGQILELSLGNALAHERTERASMTDHLTSLANRRGLELLVNERRGRRPAGVLSVDVDDLKGANDTHGHDAGDEVIVAVARAIESVLRGGDVAARVGGDEFAVVIFDAGPEATATAARRMLDALARAPAGAHPARASVGIAHAGPEESVEDALRRADEAMYEAKRAGGMRLLIARDAPVGAG
ncbi:MAG: sensor domain-containing diguanylate cyclase [Acidobacteriota bacterium]|nr:sensor domain-containing diguanylate cyclase [Acidobacteriota bacterium]